MSLDSTDDLEEQAARWAARSAHGEMTVERNAELEAWLAADRHRRGAYLRARAGLHALEEAVIEQHALHAPVNDNPPAPSGWNARKATRWLPRLAIGGAAIAACMTGLWVVGVPVLPGSGPAGAPARHEMALADGSVVTLGAGSRVSVAMEAGVRRITLENGEATFHVAKDRARPFIVRSGDVYAQATGTIYTVRRLGAVGGAVSVAEGSVLVWARDAQDRAVLLHAGGSLSLDPGAREPADAALPRPAHFSFDNMSIASAAARFNQVNRTKIVLGDPALGNTPIVGRFKTDDPEQFARAAAAVTGARVTHRQGDIVIEK
ncbi:FecR domain-containing protein [Sphingomonas sp. dw_22]|uniref:FecR family protein n=1 Tax=Sphingomonas sp. dw_22 TaxID=2721175 RepID=UPI001BD4C134|nr:FecR domain-containing protein [Sphingomonas sp. dw_22]